MKLETLPGHVAKTYDLGLTDAEIINLGLDSDNYLTRRLALIASDGERERERQQALDSVATNHGFHDPQELEPALAEYWRWQNIPDDFGLEYAEVRVMLESLSRVAVTNSDSLSRFLIDNAAMEEALEECGILDEALEIARRDYP